MENYLVRPNNSIEYADLNTFRASYFAVTVYHHQNQLMLVFDSDYVFNVVRSLFYFLYNFFEKGEITQKAHARGVKFKQWDYSGEIKVKKSKKSAIAFVNHRHAVVMYSYSLYRDAPVMFKFLNTAFVRGKRASEENNVVTVSKQYDSGKTTITLNWACDWNRAFEMLEVLREIIKENMNLDVDFSVARVRPVRAEIYVRYDRNYEKRVCEVLNLIYRRWGYERLIWDRKSEKNARNEVKYLYRVQLVLHGTRLHIKSYRRKNYREDSTDFYDDPKIEVSVYFSEKDTLEDVQRKIQLGKALLASIVYLAGISDVLIYEDTYATSVACASDDIVKSLFVTSVELKKMYADLIRDELDEYLLDYLAQASINTDGTKYIAEMFNTTSRTVRRRLQKFVDAGIVEQYRVRKTYYWTLKVAELEFSDELDIERVKQRVRELGYEIDDTGAKILYYIDRGHVTVTQLSRVLKLHRRTVQRYLSALVVANIVSCERKGRVVKYSLNFEL